MHNAALYRKSNDYQRYFVNKILEDFVSVLKWRSDGCDSVLDAGCGTGDVTADILIPILPENFRRVVGVDVCNEMLDYARKTQSHPKLSFEQFDLDVEVEKQTLNGMEPFDHIFSFFCLMWIQNQKLCMHNFHKLLNPGGDMLLVSLSYHPVFDIYKIQSQNNRWNEYMTDVDHIIKPYQYVENPQKEFSNLLVDCGFRECDVRILNDHYTYDSLESMRDMFCAVNPFIDRIPAEDKQAYMDDLMNHIAQRNYDDKQTGQIHFPQKIIVAYARK